MQNKTTQDHYNNIKIKCCKIRKAHNTFFKVNGTESLSERADKFLFNVDAVAIGGPSVCLFLT